MSTSQEEQQHGLETALPSSGGAAEASAQLPSLHTTYEPQQESGGADWLLWAIPLAMVIAFVIGTAIMFL